ncbi:MAG: EAL domain-containing protein [Emcibacter sp.]|nr:EAL domain-containing protein [Emcibacter sp.]
MSSAENSTHMESSATPCQVDDLISAMREIKRHPEGYRGVHLHFSLLDRGHKQPYHRRTIATAFNKLIQSKSGQLFWTSGFDVVFICQDSSLAQLDIAILAARRAVEDSPIIKKYIEEGRDDELCEWYDLAKDMERFMHMVGGLKNAVMSPDTPEQTQESDQDGKKEPPNAPSLKSMINNLNQTLSHSEESKPPRLKTANVTKPSYDPLTKKNASQPMGPMQLDQLERNLTNMDIDRMIADQTAFVVVGDENAKPVFIEHYVSVNEIKESLLPTYDLRADKWLFKRLTRTFDTKIMQSLPAKNILRDQVISININVETVLTPEFDKFMALFKQKNNQPLILEMGMFDVISNIQNYYEARKKLSRLGCRITLDAIDIQALPVLDRELLSVDFLKISWQPDYKKLIGSAAQDKIIAAIAEHGNMRIILCHCDTESALEFGKSFGIHMYQGFLIDKKFKSSF